MNQTEIDPKQIKKTQKRFCQLSQKRLQRMLSAFNHTQSDSILLLPLLFHANNPILPGYVDKSTPCGIPNYFPTSLDKKIAKTVSRAYKFQPRSYLKFEIAALYLMGSTGTLGQSIHSDLDLWVCLADKLNDDQYAKLQQKTELISQWMAERGVELNCYLVHQDDFKKNISKNLDKESCGDTQNYLLLDEFYRTAVWLCGRMPLWWQIPPDVDYQPLATRLIEQKHLFSSDWIDFGDVTAIPAGEYFSAALWQLFKAIESPYKSSVKLLILEIYARHFPETGLLSAQYKKRVYDGVDDLEQLDPYLMILEYTEDFLQRQPQRLEFLRRAFYLKTGAKIQLKKTKPKNNWRYHQLLELVKRWKWKQTRLDYLNNRHNWRIKAVIKEREDLVRELTHSYHFLSNFARVQGVLDKISQKELVVLGRKLYAVFERKADKIETLNHGIAKDVTETRVTLLHTNKQEWHLFLGAHTKDQLAIHSPVYKAASYFELLTWCVCNQIVNLSSRFQIYSSNGALTSRSTRQLVKNLLVILEQSEKAHHDLSNGNFENKPQISHLGIYLNTDQDPLEEEKSLGFYSVSNQADCFCWGENSLNLVAQFNVFYENSWGEYFCKSYQGEFAWIHFFNDQRDYLSSTKQLEFFFGSLPEYNQQKLRLLSLFERWNQLLEKSRKSSQCIYYLMSTGNGFLKIEFCKGEISYKHYHQAKRLLNSLVDRPQILTRHIVDKNLRLPEHFIKIIKSPPTQYTTCYLLQKSHDLIEVLLVDPLGSVFCQTHTGTELNKLASHYQQFIDNIHQRSGFLEQQYSNLQFQQLDLTAVDKGLKFSPLAQEDGLIADNYSRVQAIATHNSENKICFNLYIDDTAYLYRDYGEMVYRKLAQYLIKQRDQHRDYPIFITNLDLSVLGYQACLVEHLQYKRSIEQKLKRALSLLL